MVLVDLRLADGGDCAGRPADFDLIDTARLAEAEVDGRCVLGGEGITACDGMDPSSVSGPGSHDGPLDGLATGGGSQLDGDPVPAAHMAILQDVEALILMTGAVFDNKQVRQSIRVQVLADNGAGVEFEGGAQQEGRVEESLAGAVEKEDVVLEPVPRELATELEGELLDVELVEHQIGFGGAGVEVVPPKL